MQDTTALPKKWPTAIQNILLITIGFCPIIFSVWLAQKGGGWMEILNTVDGTYQTYGMLSRLSQGELPMIDYTPYLGVLLNYALYPFFWLFGESAFAAFAAAQTGLLLLLWGLCLVVVKINGFNGQRLFMVGTLAYLLVFMLDLVVWKNGGPWTRPGHSLVALREAPSILLASLILLMARNGDALFDLTDFKKWLLIPLSTGVLLSWSNASGISTGLAAMAIFGVLSLRQFGWKKGLGSCFLGGCLSLFAAAGTIFVLSGGQPLFHLQENFLATGGAQFWYYASYRADNKVLSLFDLYKMFPIKFILLGYFAIGLSAVYHFSRMQVRMSSRNVALWVLIAGLACSAILSQIGGHVSRHYINPLMHVLVLFGVVYWFKYFLSSKKVPFSNKTFAQSGVALVSGLIAILFGTALIFNVLEENAPKSFRELAELDQLVFVPELNMSLPLEAKSEIERIRSHREALDAAGVPAHDRSFSTYFAWLDLLLGASEPTRFNSIIHVFGDDSRHQYAQDFTSKNFAYLFTSSPYQTAWEAWNLRANWFFFREVLQRYKIDFRGISQLHWVPATESLIVENDQRFACEIVQKDAETVQLSLIEQPTVSQDLDPFLVEFSVDYTMDPGRVKPSLSDGLFLGRGFVRVVDLTPALKQRYDLPGYPRIHPRDEQGRLTYGLPSGQHSTQLGLEHQPGTDSFILLQAVGSDEASVTVSDCQVSLIVKSPFIGLENVPSWQD